MNLRQLKVLPVLFILIALVYLCFQIISHSLTNQSNKKDYAELNHVQYGLFNINEWKEQVSGILISKIDDLYLIKTHKKELKTLIERQLEVLIDSIYKKLEKAHTRSLKGFFKLSFLETFVDIKEIKKGIPHYADALIKELEKTQTQEQFRNIVKERIQGYLDQTFGVQDQSKIQKILQKTKSSDIESARREVNKRISQTNDSLSRLTLGLIALSIFPFAFLSFSRKQVGPLDCVLLILTLAVLLTAGVTTPMIDIEAKISDLSFIMMGHTISFKDQVIFFQTKSIMDIFWIMINHKDFSMKIVGVLMVTFCIIFPLAKMTSSLLYYFNVGNLQNNRIVNFFVFKSGKWSMADVLVVAIFMAYIGFNGIIKGQLNKLSSQLQDMPFLTTNGTSLQWGFYLFLTYVLLALFLSKFLGNKKTP